MSTDFEKYLRRNRNELDVDNPDDQLIWEGIRKEMHSDEDGKGKRKLWPMIRNIAAAAVVVLAIGYMLGDLVGEQRNAGLAGLDQKLGTREGEYRDVLTAKLAEAGQYNPGLHSQVIAELYSEIQKLDTIYEQSLKDLADLGYNEQIIHTIFDTYEKKIYLLELIILETDKTKIHETDPSILL
jgi:hypothetical protein